jgi:hypothetical protein
MVIAQHGNFTMIAIQVNIVKATGAAEVVGEAGAVPVEGGAAAEKKEERAPE